MSAAPSGFAELDIIAKYLICSFMISEVATNYYFVEKPMTHGTTFLWNSIMRRVVSFSLCFYESQMARSLLSIGTFVASYSSFELAAAGVTFTRAF